MAEKTLNALTEHLENEAKRIEKAESISEEIKAQEEDGYDGFTTLKLIPSPNFTDAKSVGTMLPINMANETVTNLSLLSQQFDFVDFIKEKLGYSSRLKVVQCFASEQIDALVLAIKSFEKNNAFILGDMAGIGKGRVCAGVLRYAYNNNIIPVFITHKPYLFSDIYRDLSDIDGFGQNKRGAVYPKPFILHQDGLVKNMDNKIVAVPLRNSETLEICKEVTKNAEKGKIALPKEYNCVFLPYSTLSMSRTTIKQSFLEAIAPNAIYVFDESHNAASAEKSSNILKRALPIVEASKAVLFSSATYAKTPAVFNLYVVKTALRTAVPSLESITDALKVGGENVSEYIASGLVKEGQMIRRERSFGDCKKVTDYVGYVRSEDYFGKTSYTALENDNQRRFYDEAIGYFKELRDFSKSDLSKNGIFNSIVRKCEEEGKVLANMLIYKEALDASGDDALSIQNSFIKNNRGKYIVTYRADSISRYKQTFRENLFLAVKAKFSADKIIECLTTPVNYTNIDGSSNTAPMKPVVAIKNTGEAIFNELKLKQGDELNNDFSEYIRAIYLKLFSGEFTLRKIDNNIFESTSSLIDRGINYEEIKYEYNVQLTDFADGGAMISDIQSRLSAYNSQLPFSVIDYLRDKIESVERPAFYYTDDNKITPKYGQAASSTFKMAEATARKYMLVRNGDNWMYVKNDRIPSTTDVFKSFNNGIVDVMLINVVASTGGSAQSSPKEGSDTRPRNMFIIQFELDINTEVQKRGRINRTGQINSPTYTYIISKIPVELRTYLMFRKKLRKLDANTSADQTSSSKASEITDDKGEAIEDIFNAYGFEVFQKDFIDLPQNIEYKLIFDEMSIRTKSNFSGDAEQTEYNIEQFNVFVRELELYPCDFQEYFFNQMNEKYIQKVTQLKATDEYQIELGTKNYKAALKQRVVVQLNSGTTVFSLPLFISDYYTLDDKRILSKDKVLQKANELSVTPSGRALPMNQFHIELIENYTKEFSKSKEMLMEAFRQGIPERSRFATDEDFKLAIDRFGGRENKLSRDQDEARNRMIDLMRFFKPMKPVVYLGNYGVFVGYKVKDTGSRFKYSDGSIDFIFCFLSKFPVLHLKVSSDLETLKSIMILTEMSSMIQNENENSKMSKAVLEWKPDLNKRTIKRFLSGNILSGIIEANKKKSANEITSWVLTRFNNTDGSVTTAIELKFSKDLPETTLIQTENQTLSIASDNINFATYLDEVPVSRDEEVLPIWNIESDKVIERCIAIVKREIRWRDQIHVEVMQPYVDKDGKIKELDEKSTRYNPIYFDRVLMDRFRSNLMNPAGSKQTIKYAQIKTEVVEKGVKTYKRKYIKYNVNIRTFEFDLERDRDTMKGFFDYLYGKYESSFNFRSSNADYFNIQSQSDIFDPTVKEEKKQAFEEGDYQYRFIRKVSDSFVDTIPNVKSKILEGAFGGVILTYPLSPSILPSYQMKPYRLPNEVMVKLTLGVLSDEDKAVFAKSLEEMAEVLDAYEVGKFVQEFISKRSVETIYFFGDLRMSEYGSIFKEYGLKKDISKIAFEVEEEIKDVKTPIDKVTFEGAENYLISIWSQL